jgi:hypothetical protein
MVLMASRIQTTNHKRSDTFTRKIIVSDADGVVDLTGDSVTSQVKTWDFSAVATLTIDTSGAATGEILISASDTSAWPLTDEERPLICDLKIVSGDTVRTDTFGIIVVRQVTD